MEMPMLQNHAQISLTALVCLSQEATITIMEDQLVFQNPLILDTIPPLELATLLDQLQPTMTAAITTTMTLPIISLPLASAWLDAPHRSSMPLPVLKLVRVLWVLALILLSPRPLTKLAA